MDNINLEEQITSYLLIQDKMVSDLTFKDVISLVFHAFERLSKDINPNPISFGTYYQDFLLELHQQNQMGWPKLLINRNDHRRRLDVCCLEPYVASQNFLMILFRMLYIENYKRTYVQKSYDYYKILGHKLEQNGATHTLSIIDLNIPQLFILAEACLRHYINVYRDPLNIEHQLGLSLLKYLE